MPIILFSKDFWGGLVDWIKTTMIENGVIDKNDLKILHLVDTIEEVIEIIRNYYQNSYHAKEHAKIIF